MADASIAIGWIHPSQASTESEALLTQLERGATVVVPTIWFAETANGLLVLERRKKITTQERLKALAKLTSLNISADPEGYGLIFNRVSELAAEHGLSVYDACYLELAARQQAILGSNDQSLRKAAASFGVKLI